MEGGEDASSEEPAYVTTTAESPANILHIQVDMADDERGGEVWGIHGDGAGQADDVSTVATRLRHLDDIGNREDFHRQCCEVSCCTAKQVIEIMHSGSYKVSLVQIASEIFLLQNLLNPTHYNCTEELLDSWLSVQEEKDQGTSAILENVNKMVALVESVDHLVIFLRSLLKRFGTRFLGLCSDLALRALKQLRHLAAGEGGGERGDCASREKLTQTLDLVEQMYHETHRQIYLSCLLSALYVDPTDRRYFALDAAFSRMSDATVTDVGSIPVSCDILSDLLHTINLFRSIDLDLDLGWMKLKPLITDLLFNAGYCYDPSNNTFGSGVPQSSAFSSGLIGDPAWLRVTQQLDCNQTMTMSERAWCGVSNSFHCSTSSAFVEGKKPWSAGDATSAVSTSLWSVVKTDERELTPVNGRMVDDMPDSTSTQVTTREGHVGSNGSVDNNGFGSIHEPWKGARRAWLESDDEASNPLNIASEEEEDVSSVTDEVTTAFEGTTASAFSKKRSASAEMMGMMSSSLLVAEPCRKRRAVSISQSKRGGGVDTEAERVAHDDDRAKRHMTRDVGSCERKLRPKDRSQRNRVVTRNTFCFRYKYSSASFSQLSADESGRRCMSESDTSSSSSSSAAASKATVSVPNGVKLRNCFIRLNRVQAQTMQNQPSQTDVIDAEPTNCASMTTKDTPQALSARLTFKEETRTGSASLTFKEDQICGSALSTIEEATSSHAPSLLRVEERSEEVVKEEEVAAVEKVVQCVCDGCGEIVPDCSWLTAHIVTCTGRSESGVADAVTDDELSSTFRSDAPIWDALGGQGDNCPTDAVTTATVANGDGSVEGMMDTGSEMVAFDSQSPNDVEAASNLMQQLMQNGDNQSAFIYDPSMTSETTEVIRMSDGTAFSMATAPASSSDGAEDAAEDDQCGKEVLYNGVLMYEFSEYQCDLCLLTFASQSLTAEHIRSSDHGASSISRQSFCCCLKCSIRYREKHIMWHHALYLCGSAIDEQTDESRLYRCLLCCKAFLSAAFLRRHVCLQHGRHALAPSSGGGHAPIIESSSSDGVARHRLSGVRSGDAAQVVSRLAEYGVGLDGQLLGTWNCYQVNDGGGGRGGSSEGGGAVSGGFQVPGGDTMEAKVKAGERNGANNGTSGSTNGGGGGGEAGADSQALLDLACSIVLGGCSPPAANFPPEGASAPTSAGQPSPATPTIPPATPSATASQSSPASAAGTSAASSSRRTAKGIMYKNVFMQCIVNYLCSTCKKDLSTKASKKDHKSSPCFDADSRRFTYLRQYSYLCPYCSEKFPSQKFCRQHQLSVCLQLMGVKTDELNHKQLLCPFCDRKYFNIITLKGHMTLIHKINKLESSQLLGTTGLLEELISFAPDAAGLSEKAKKAKQQTTAEEDRKHAEANRLHPPNPPPKPPLASKETTPQNTLDPGKGVFPAEKKSEGDLKVETGLEKNESKEEQQNPSVCSSEQMSDDLDNGTSHDSALVSSVVDATTPTSESCIKDVDRCELQIVEVADPDGMTFDDDASDTSTDDPSEPDDLGCETDNTLPTNDIKESQIKEEEDEAMMEDAKRSVKHKKSNRKTRRKVATKSRKKLH